MPFLLFRSGYYKNRVNSAWGREKHYVAQDNFYDASQPQGGGEAALETKKFSINS